jgi:hypothetical protein
MIDFIGSLSARISIAAGLVAPAITFVTEVINYLTTLGETGYLDPEPSLTTAARC